MVAWDLCSQASQNITGHIYAPSLHAVQHFYTWRDEKGMKCGMECYTPII